MQCLILRLHIVPYLLLLTILSALGSTVIAYFPQRSSNEKQDCTVLYSCKSLGVLIVFTNSNQFEVDVAEANSPIERMIFIMSDHECTSPPASEESFTDPQLDEEGGGSPLTEAVSKEESADGDLLTKPKRPLSAYNLFFRDQRGLLLDNLPTRGDDKPKRSHGKIGFKDLARTIAARWKDIAPDEKERYESIAAEGREKYLKRAKEWKKQQKKLGKVAKRQQKNASKAASASVVRQVLSTSVVGRFASRSDEAIANWTSPPMYSHAATASGMLFLPLRSVPDNSSLPQEYRVLPQLLTASLQPPPTGSIRYERVTHGQPPVPAFDDAKSRAADFTASFNTSFEPVPIARHQSMTEQTFGRQSVGHGDNSFHPDAHAPIAFVPTQMQAEDDLTPISYHPQAMEYRPGDNNANLHRLASQMGRDYVNQFVDMFSGEGYDQSSQYLP
jgi:hypothetical protein